MQGGGGGDFRPLAQFTSWTCDNMGLLLAIISLFDMSYQSDITCFDLPQKYEASLDLIMSFVTILVLGFLYFIFYFFVLYFCCCFF